MFVNCYHILTRTIALENTIIECMSTFTFNHFKLKIILTLTYDNFWNKMHTYHTIHRLNHKKEGKSLETLIKIHWIGNEKKNLNADKLHRGKKGKKIIYLYYSTTAKVDLSTFFYAVNGEKNMRCKFYKHVDSYSVE